MDEDEFDDYDYDEDCCDYDDDDDDYEDDAVVRRYHAVNRNTIYKNVNWKDPSLLGLEIETYIKSGDVDETVMSLLKDTDDIIAEEDGSIDRNRGVEFIFKPVPFSDITEDSFIGKWAKSLQSKSGVSWNAGRNYGMHISMNVGAMTELHIGKICHFINTNTNLAIKLAGRNSESWAAYQNYSKVTQWKYETDKYMATSRRSQKRLEVRIFRGSLNWERIRRNCEFLDAVRRFTKICGVNDLTQDKFIEFIQYNDNKKSYRLLNKFIKEKINVHSHSQAT